MSIDRIQADKLLSLAVHELRTPASVTAGYVKMVLQFHGQSLSDDARKFLVDAADSSAKLAALLSEMGELSNLMAGNIPLKSEEVAIFAMAAEVAGTMTDAEQRGVRVEVAGADPAVRFKGDAHWLRTSLRAIVAATVRERIRPGVVRLECRVARAGRYRWAILGIGADEAAEVLASLPPGRWGPFDLWRGGVGLSLPTAVHIITAHGGRIGSLPGAPVRGAAAIALPIRE